MITSHRSLFRSVGCLGLALVTILVLSLAVQSGHASTAPLLAPVSATELGAARSPASLWIGDSYTGGTGAPSSAQGYPCLAAATMGWICNLDAQGETGFINNGHGNTKTFQPMIDRVPADQARFLADVVVIDGGRNDGYALPDVEAAIARYDEAIHKAYPKAKLVQIVPAYLTTRSELYAGQLAAFIHQEMHKLGGYVVDPLAEGWMSRSIGLRLLYKDHVHPNAAGHRYIARHLVADFRRFGLQHVAVTDHPTLNP